MDASPHHWFTSSFSGGSGNGCVEVAFLSADTIGIRDTKDRTRPSQIYSASAWTKFVTAIRSSQLSLVKDSVNTPKRVEHVLGSASDSGPAEPVTPIS
jgi:hypothetical protein